MARYVVTTFRFRQLSTASLLITRQQIEIKTMNFQQPNTTISTRELRLLIEDHLKALWEEKSFLSTQGSQSDSTSDDLGRSRRRQIDLDS